MPLTNSPLTPAMRDLLERMARVQRPALHTLSAERARAAYERGAEVLDLPRAPLARVQDLTLPMPAGHARPARLYAPSHEVLPVLLYLHGGGFTIGGLETHDSLCRQLALRSGVAVVSLDYRLAPEHPFPAAVDDCWAAMHALSQHAAQWGLDGSRLAVGGDSAGGTLTATCALHARDVGMRLALQLLITPGTAALQDSPSHARFAQGHVLDAPAMRWFFDHYIALDQRHDWRFAPLHAASVAGTAPACVLLAECDPLVDEGVAYAERLRMAGVPVALEVYGGVTHDFIKMGRVLPEAEHALGMAATALRQALLG
jgi:acetyl esterase